MTNLIKQKLTTVHLFNQKIRLIILIFTAFHIQSFANSETIYTRIWNVNSHIFYQLNTLINENLIYPKADTIPYDRNFDGDYNTIIDSLSKKYPDSVQSDIIINHIDGFTQKGKLYQLFESEIVIKNQNQLINQDVTNILGLEIVKKKKNSGSKIFGMILGAVPGIIYFRSINSENNLLKAITSDPTERLFAVVLTIGGSIAGAKIGSSLGKGISVQIPINSSKKLYQRQKSKIINHAFKLY